jgi:RecA/RadA recombinase
MSSAPARNIIELRQLLAEKFPGVRMEAGRRETLVERWPTGIPQIDFQLEGGLAKSCITEMMSTGVGCGSSLLITHLIAQARENGQWMALIDSVDSFDPSALDNDELSRLLWVRCSSAKTAMKAADLVLHDGTIGLITIDLVSCPRVQLRRVSSSNWHRLARTLEKTAAVCLVLTPEPMISTAAARLQLQPRFGLNSVDDSRDTLIQQVTAQPAAERNMTRFRKAQ